MLRWMCCKIRREIRNFNIRERFGVASIVKKNVENRMHMHREDMQIL